MTKPRIISLWPMLWSAAAVGAFAALQLQRIAWSDRIRRDIRPSGPHELSPGFV